MRKLAPFKAFPSIILSALSALAFSGCEDACQKGLQLKTDLTRLETIVSGTIVQMSNMNQSCADVRKNWRPELVQASDFALRVAQNYFYSEEHHCIGYHYERQCWWERYPHSPGYYHCRDVAVCDRYEVIPHKSDGYEQAVDLSRTLRGSADDLESACLAHERNMDAEALVKLLTAKEQIKAAQDDTEYVLQRAGCYERRGD